MNNREKFKNEKVASYFPVKKNVSNDEALQMVYKDFSRKLDWINNLYPYSGGKLSMYNIFNKYFEIDIPHFFVADVEYLSDTFEESQKAFEDGIFNVEHTYFGRGEWPIILMWRFRIVGKDKDDWICYQITR
jgi:hypothetical protein